MTDREPEDRQQEVLAVVVKFLAIALAIGLAIGIVTWLVVKSLDLNAGNANSSNAPDPASIQPLPVTALPTPTPTGQPTDLPTAVPTDPFATASPNSKDLVLSALPVVVKPMERINLTGEWAGQDGVALMVQRFEGGSWVDFGVQVDVKLGSFATYVETSHPGDNKFRVFDPNTNSASNPVTVTVG